MCAMMFGVLYMAMPIAIVGNNFYDLFKLRHKSHGCVGSISFAPGCTRRVDTHSGVRWSAQLQATRTRHAARANALHRASTLCCGGFGAGSRRCRGRRGPPPTPAAHPRPAPSSANLYCSCSSLSVERLAGRHRLVRALPWLPPHTVW